MISISKKILILAYLFFAGCVQLTYHEISDDSFYMKIVGTTYATRDEMKLCRVYRESAGNGENFQYIITALPGIGGNELKQLGQLPTGTILTITKVYQRTPSLTLSNNGIQFFAKIQSPGPFYGLEVYINGVFETYSRAATHGKYILNKQHFTELDHGSIFKDS